MKELTKEQMKLADQMVEDLQIELKYEIASQTKDIMGDKPIEKPVSKSNPLVDGIIEWGNTLDIDNLPENSVLCIKINVDNTEYAHNFQMGIVRQVLEPRFDKLKEKHVTVLFLSSKDDISVLTEKDMEVSGWIRREPSRIIIP